MGKYHSARSSLGKRVVVLILTIGLIAVAVYMWMASVGDPVTAGVVIMGIVLGTI